MCVCPCVFYMCTYMYVTCLCLNRLLFNGCQLIVPSTCSQSVTRGHNAGHVWCPRREKLSCFTDTLYRYEMFFIVKPNKLTKNVLFDYILRDLFPNVSASSLVLLSMRIPFPRNPFLQQPIAQKPLLPSSELPSLLTSVGKFLLTFP